MDGELQYIIMKKSSFILGIDGSNIKDGGGLTYLIELLKVANPRKYNFKQIILWSNKKTLSKIEDYSWLVKSPVPILEKNYIYRTYWQWNILSKSLIKKKCDILFSPGGSILSNFNPVVTMSRNMLPFEWKEIKRFGFSYMTLRYLILNIIQLNSFRRSNGLIFLSQYATDRITSFDKKRIKEYKIINHGINKNLFIKPKLQISINNYTFKNPFKLLYVSIINLYKHQWNVVYAVKKLRDQGVPIELTLIGPSYKPAIEKLEKAILKSDPENQFVKYLGKKKYKELKTYYHSSDAFIFASSCENLPNILLEAMASGLPIISSNRGPMPEVLKDSSMFFDPENIKSIVDCLGIFIQSDKIRYDLAQKSYKYSLNYTWDKCSHETFSFLKKYQTNKLF
jgi:glycosyltransferase involved in cell wall biosynthesis